MKRTGSDYWKKYHDDFWDSPDVLAMTPAEAGVFDYLLGLQAKYGKLPVDPKSVAALCSRFPNFLRWYWPTLERLFPVDPTGTFRANPRQAVELAQIDQKRAQDADRKYAERLRKAEEKRVREAREVDARSMRSPREVDATSPRQADDTLQNGLFDTRNANGHADITLERRGEERRVEEEEDQKKRAAPSGAAVVQMVDGKPAIPVVLKKRAPSGMVQEIIAWWLDNFPLEVFDEHGEPVTYQMHAGDAPAVAKLVREQKGWLTLEVFRERALALLRTTQRYWLTNRNLRTLCSRWTDIASLPLEEHARANSGYQDHVQLGAQAVIGTQPNRNQVTGHGISRGRDSIPGRDQRVPAAPRGSLPQVPALPAHGSPVPQQARESAPGHAPSSGQRVDREEQGIPRPLRTAHGVQDARSLFGGPDILDGPL